MVLRGLHTAIVDEADSVLIDEAVTPLIIAASHENESLREAARLAQEMIGVLKPEADYHSNPRYKEIEMTKAGLQKLVEQASHLPGLWRGHDRRLELVIQALVAREFFTATNNISSKATRSSLWTNSPAGRCRSAPGGKGCIRPLKPRKLCRFPIRPKPSRD